MKKIILSFLIGISSLFVHAHSSQITTMTLAQDEHSDWTLHMSSSFEGFRYQLIENYPDIKTDELLADEFQKLVVEYIRDNIFLDANSGFVGELKEGAIKLGHQTDLKFRVSGLPNEISNLRVKLKGFDETSNHNTVFRIIDQSDTSKNFIIKKDNQFTVQIQKVGGKFQAKGQEPNLLWPFVSLSILVVVSVIIISKIFKPEETLLRPVKSF